MEDKRQAKLLYDLIVASLISEADFDRLSNELLLKSPIDKKRLFYLSDIINNSHLGSYLDINTQKGQYTIHSHSLLKTFKQNWYKNSTKIFSGILDPRLINLQSIAISVNLFGIRKLETISIPTTIDKAYVKALSYCIEQHIHVPVIPSGSQIKISNIPQFITSVIDELPAIHSAELINFLTEKEKKGIMEGVRN